MHEQLLAALSLQSPPATQDEDGANAQIAAAFLAATKRRD